MAKLWLVLAALLILNGVRCQKFEHGKFVVLILLNLFSFSQKFIIREYSVPDVVVDDDVDEHDRNMHPSFSPGSHEQRVMPVRAEELDISFWKENAQKYLREILAADSYNTPKRAKNVILFMGDGMSLATVAAARMYMGGEEKSLSFERFPHFGLSKVYIEQACSANIDRDEYKYFFSLCRLIVSINRSLILHARQRHI